MRVLELLPSSTILERKFIAHFTAREKFNDQPMPNSTTLHITSTKNHGNLMSSLSGRVAIDAGDPSDIKPPMTDKCDGRVCICREATCSQMCQSGPKDDAILSNADVSDKDVFAAVAHISITSLLEV
ncbi:uncharacterized protein EAF02_007743 [Botrytis sinoallii]|uniref:uncharacterized protein n=1 Tax=Botrytis sinoallii TaxID=1463999 RepID=UPI0019026F55|nr:uncharacterized protein EAF02_007743 [Botrytis sinoallii]KAF7880106.1 hypothetical protein EAF02_007743 [Botrytis sinoallii]